MKVAILAAGPLGAPGTARKAASGASLVVAADGGARHAGTLGLSVDLVVGDADSLAAGEVAALFARGVEVRRHPREKDETDLELALRLARERGATEMVVLGALGRRWDHSLAALLLAADPSFHGIDLRLIDGAQEILILRGGSEKVLDEKVGTTVSLLPLGQSASGITTRGLAFPLDAGELRFGSPRGVSNRVVARPASIRLDRGVLAVIVTRNARLLA